MITMFNTLVKIANDLGYKVRVGGSSDLCDGERKIIYLKRYRKPESQIITFLHELGHAYLYECPLYHKRFPGFDPRARLDTNYTSSFEEEVLAWEYGLKIALDEGFDEKILKGFHRYKTDCLRAYFNFFTQNIMN